MSRKGMVVESGDNWAILLLNDGEYKRIKTNRRMHEGEIYKFSRIPDYKSLVTAAVLLIMVTFSLNFFPISAYASISSGVDLGINRWGQIVYMKVSTPEGERLIEGMGIWGHDIEEVLPELLDRAVAFEQEKGNSNDIAIDIKSAQTEVRDDQPALEKINKTVSEHKNSNSSGYWNYRDDDTRWRWEATDKEKDDKQGNARSHNNENKQNGKNSNDERDNDIEDQKGKRRNQSDDYSRSDNNSHDHDSDGKQGRNGEGEDSHGTRK